MRLCKQIKSTGSLASHGHSHENERLCVLYILIKLTIRCWTKSSYKIIKYIPPSEGKWKQESLIYFGNIQGDLISHHPPCRVCLFEEMHGQCSSLSIHLFPGDHILSSFATPPPPSVDSANEGWWKENRTSSLTLTPTLLFSKAGNCDGRIPGPTEGNCNTVPLIQVPETVCIHTVISEFHKRSQVFTYRLEISPCSD